ncbi:MAG: winged helix-turn-helix domain-containing protein [Candidatus Bathyarchaeota archaeon]|nr:winged helix-turn-helix domain-containing protein [Candidatus Bathyarchaeota archaeon]
MKKIARRDKLKIYGDLLTVLCAESKEDKIVLTRVQVQIKVPFDRLKTYIRELDELGLIQDQTSLRLTEKGKQYLVEYENVLDFMKRMGIAYR